MTNQTNYLILLPPSEGKNSTGNNKAYKQIKHTNSFPELNIFRDEIQTKLQKELNNSNQSEQEKILELKNQKLTEAVNLNITLNNQNTSTGIARYSGTMFKSINYNQMSQIQKDNFNNSTIFIDGMFGLLKPLDLIPNYKLKITSKFNNYNITKFWKENLKQTLTNLFQTKELIIDILPQSHKKIINYQNLNCLEIIFAKIKNNKLTNVGHDSKVLKGEIINFITNFQNISRNELENWKHSLGYNYSKEYSNKNKIIYLKN